MRSSGTSGHGDGPRRRIAGLAGLCVGVAAAGCSITTSIEYHESRADGYVLRCHEMPVEDCERLGEQLADEVRSRQPRPLLVSITIDGDSAEVCVGSAATPSCEKQPVSLR